MDVRTWTSVAAFRLILILTTVRPSIVMTNILFN